MACQNWSKTGNIRNMRMRKKSNLESRIENSNDYLLRYEGEFTNAIEFIKEKDYVDYKEVFGNDNKVCLDVGCGLGGFAIQISKKFPDVNFIAIEMFSNVIIGAIDKARLEEVKNLRFLNCRCECLEKYIKPHSIDTIYLNFSNPLPNKCDARQRLTNPRFLSINRLLLKEGGKIIQKTDDRDFFEYSLQMYKDEGFEILDECWDLAHLDDKENIITEHEKKYMEQGKLIYRAIVQA